MKKIALLFILISSYAYSQMPNISNVWMNNGNPYVGKIGDGKDNAVLKMRFTLSEQDKKNDQEYFISGVSGVENHFSNFEGKIRITKYKDGKKKSTVFGEYDIAEEPKGKHSGTFKGKFVYTFKWNKKTEKVEAQYIEFIGTWKSYDGTLNYKAVWKNQEQ
ncbi:MAG: hypothetical protein QM564_00965 [Bergeyella sp.]